MNVSSVQSAALEEIEENTEDDPELATMYKDRIRPRKGPNVEPVTEEFLTRKLASTKSELRAKRGVKLPSPAYWSNSKAKLLLCCDPVSFSSLDCPLK